MLDENLPTFYLKSSTDGVKHHASVLLAQYGDEPTPAYSIRRPDPALPSSKNRYAVALYDSYYPEILYGEVLLIPDWTQPTLSKDETRKNGGVPPPPQPILPTSFIIQLYNPDQQVTVKLKVGSWGSTNSWEFEMPQQSFRQPSNSAIDRTQSDPTVSDTTPKVSFKWKREGRFSPDYLCNMVGKSTNPDGSKRKHQEPDIAIALFKNLREITLYESNLARTEMEDLKGLEIVTILAAIVLREVFHSTLQEAFNVSGDSAKTPPARPTIISNLSSSPPPQQSHHAYNPSQRPSSRQHHRPSAIESTQRLPLETGSERPSVTASNPTLPPTDPRSQWELDREATQLKKQVEREEHERRKAERAETRRIKKMLEDEERQWNEAERKRKADIDRETDRLRREFEDEQRRLGLPQRPHSAQAFGQRQHGNPPRWPQQGPSLQAVPQSTGGSSRPEAQPKRKKNFWGLRSGTGMDNPSRVRKKQSTMF